MMGMPCEFITTIEIDVFYVILSIPDTPATRRWTPSSYSSFFTSQVLAESIIPLKLCKKKRIEVVTLFSEVMPYQVWLKVLEKQQSVIHLMLILWMKWCIIFWQPFKHRYSVRRYRSQTPIFFTSISRPSGKPFLSPPPPFFPTTSRIWRNSDASWDDAYANFQSVWLWII